MNYKDMVEALEEQKIHDAMIASADFIRDKGLGEFLHQLGEYSPCPHLLFVAGYALKLEREQNIYAE